MTEYEVIAEDGIRLDRRYAKGKKIPLSDAQARYLLLNGKIRKAGGDPEQATPALPSPEES